MQLADAVRTAAQPKRQHRHLERLAVVIRKHSAQRKKPLSVDAEFGEIGAEILVHQLDAEFVETRLDRRVYCKDVARPRGFDGQGNYTLGLKEQIIFPEIDYDKIDVIKGLNISFITSAKTDAEGHALLAQLGMPFRA